jgi:endonuclease/exonuclease/phosphatase family metal-dependent hydrolase
MGKKFEKSVFVSIVCLSVLSDSLHAQEKPNTAGSLISIMTYNLKFASPTYKPLWEVRRDMQIDLINKYNPDIIGTQEGLKEQIDYLADHLPEYVVVGEGRQGGDDDEHMAIFYKRDKFRLRELNSFALSSTPDRIGSGPNVNPRLMTWARFAFINTPKTGQESAYPADYRGHWENNQEFYVFNTHFFNGREPQGRLSASKLIMERMEKLNHFGSWEQERPIFLLGDFNCHPKSAPHKVFVGEGNSENSDLFKDTNVNGDSKEIDWILYKGSVEVLKYEEVNYNVDGVYPSDHKPIFVKFLINI